MNLKKQIIKFLAAGILLVVLAVGVVACDNAQHDEDKQTEPEVTTTDPTETTTPVETTTPTKETTTELTESLSQEELIEKYSMNEEEIKDWQQKLLGVEPEFANGVNKMAFMVGNSYVHVSIFSKGSPLTYYNDFISHSEFEIIQSIAENYLYESKDCPPDKKRYDIDITEEIPEDLLYAIFKIVKDAPYIPGTPLNTK